MRKIKYSFILVLTFVATLVISCKDLTELNINPNGVDPAKADPNLLLATIITSLAQNVVSLGYGDIAGVMQHTQYDGWSGGHNDYDWDNTSSSWGSYYDILRNNKEFYNKAVAGGLEFHQGVALVMKAYTFGLITDLWGDAPYSAALNAEEGGEANFKPKFDSQQDIYKGILADLETANQLLSKSQDAYIGIIPTQDVLYNGDVTKWRKFANSLALRYYLRISAKDEATSKAGIKKIFDDPATYPIITSSDDDANVGFIGNAPYNSWPNNTVYDKSTSGMYMRTKMCATLVNVMKALQDPRLPVWANKVEIPLVLEPSWPDNQDKIIDGKRHISQNIADHYVAVTGNPIDYSTDYIGIPPSNAFASIYNLNPNLEQGTYNPHCSQLNDIYKDAVGSLLKSRLMSAAEVNFILAEAALKGWISASAETYYDAGIQQSLNAWGVGSAYSAYLPNAPFGGLAEIMQQKWIASWTAAAESWFDYRRTGLPALQTGGTAKRAVLPVRFYYHYDSEIALNPDNANAAINALESTPYTSPDTKNSAWSKSWLLQGTGKPW